VDSLLPSRPCEADRCPGCGSCDARVFYEVLGAPVHGFGLMETRGDALACRRADVRLAFCGGCGLVWNTRFDAAVRDGSGRSEEFQGFSPRYQAFSRALADHLIDRYGVRGRDILEIGCGKGEFLALICARGGNRGVGIDPSYVPERNPAPPRAPIRFIRDSFSERYTDLTADLVCCRHTLEHIGPVAQFVRTIHRTVGCRRGTVVFFEVPDVLRILREGAFWDVSYERCSYFSHGSLARLIRECGFDLLDLYRDFDDQDLFLEARSHEEPTRFPILVGEDLETLREAVEGFEEASTRGLERWTSFFGEAADAGRRVALWESGSKGVSFLSTLRLGPEVECVVDVNPYRQGKWVPGSGQPIVSPRSLLSLRPDAVLVMNPALGDLGLRPEVLAP
jgi:SAM-dependent methyltransferase